MADTFRVEELIAIMSGPQGSIDMKDGLTIEELAGLAGKSMEWVKDRLKVLIARGFVEVGSKMQMDLSGRTKPASAYKFLIPKEGKK